MIGNEKEELTAQSLGNSAPRALGQTFAEISLRAARFYRGGMLSVLLAVILGSVYLIWAGKPTLAPYILISTAALVAAWSWRRRAAIGLPFLFLFLTQQLVIYGLPLLVIDEELARIPEELVMRAAVSVAVLFAFLIPGFHMGIRFGGPPRGARFPIGLSRGNSEKAKAWRLAVLLLSIGLTFQVANRAGLIFTLLPDSLGNFYPVIRTFADAAATLGALLGGIAISDRLTSPRAVKYWILMASIFFLSIADVLLSAATGLILSSAVGLALGKGRIPWAYLLLVAALVGFLNRSKFEMRNQYWDEESNTTRISLTDLPSFYGNWFSKSFEFFVDPVERDRLLALDRGGGEDDEIDEETGQSILDRVDNLNILVYSAAAVSETNIPTLKGATYTLVPKLLIPRFLWPNKPGTHEGQALLNLHFKRQKTVEQTQKTYIAWGALPEAIGNFGIFLGPGLLGLFLGWVFGFLEKVSLRKSLFSIEGFLLISFLLKITVSFEMVASVFITSSFQFLVVVMIGGLILRSIFFDDGSPEERSFPRRY